MNESDTKQAESKNVCGAILTIVDDYSDNHATLHCQLESGHAGDHYETYEPYKNQKVRVYWTVDEGPEVF